MQEVWKGDPGYWRRGILSLLRDEAGEDRDPQEAGQWDGDRHQVAERKVSGHYQPGHMVLFADNMKIYIENPKDTIRKLLELINEFGKVIDYKINTQKSIVFLYLSMKV